MNKKKMLKMKLKM